MSRTFQMLAALAVFACAVSSAEAEFYWLLSGDLKNNAGASSDLNGQTGLGCWLELTNDVAGVDFRPVKIYDIRRKTTGGTDLVKYNGNAKMIPFDDCRYGEAVVDLSLPIRGADGTSYQLAALYSFAFQENYYIGKVVLTNSLEYIGNRAFQNCKYLQTVVMPDPATWTPEYIGKETDEGRVFDGCERLSSAIAWPDNLKFVPQYTFSGAGALKGFSGNSVTNYRVGAFNSIPTTFCLEMSKAETISFTGEVVGFDGRPHVIVWHETPPSTNDYFSKNGTSFMKRSGTSRVHYIPYDATQEGGVPARWAAYKPAFEAETSGNSLTFPVYDPATRTQTDGSWYINGRSGNADKVRFWFPDEQAALLIK